MSCHEWEWKAATNVPDQRLRKGRPTGKFRNLPITFETTELETFEELMPLSWMGLLGRLRVNAAHNRDRNTHTASPDIQLHAATCQCTGMYLHSGALLQRQRNALLSVPSASTKKYTI
jgi:hypothetical protein